MSCCESKDATTELRSATPVTGVPEIVDHKVTLLIAAGAAMAANCEPCLNKVVPSLIEAGVSMADIRNAVLTGQAVKDRPAALMKEAADVLTGTQLSGRSIKASCSIEKMKRKEESATLSQPRFR